MAWSGAAACGSCRAFIALNHAFFEAAFNKSGCVVFRARNSDVVFAHVKNVLLLSPPSTGSGLAGDDER